MTTKPQVSTHTFTTDHEKHYKPNPEATHRDLIVSKGDTWESIAKKNNVPLDKLLNHNVPGSVRNGKVDYRAINRFLINRHGCPRTRDGRNAMFKGGETISIPYPSVAQSQPQFMCPPEDGMHPWVTGQIQSNNMLCVGVVHSEPPDVQPAPIVIDGKNMKWTSDFTNDDGWKVRYGVSATNPRQVTVIYKDQIHEYIFPQPAPAYATVGFEQHVRAALKSTPYRGPAPKYYGNVAYKKLQILQELDADMLWVPIQKKFDLDATLNELQRRREKNRIEFDERIRKEAESRVQSGGGGAGQRD